MKLIVAGSRSINNYNLIDKHLSKIKDKITEIVSGGASGVDKLGELWARNNAKQRIIFPADWNKHGKSAGYIRNTEMAKYADSAIIFWDGISKGSKHMYDIMLEYKKPVLLINNTTQKYKEFDCGCKIPINENGGLDIKFVLSEINMNCPKTWEIIQRGETIGVFQLESHFAQGLAKKLKPENDEHLSALAAIIRPGAKESIRDGKSITDHYIDRKNGIEDIVAKPAVLEPILQDTLCEMIYQENAINIAKEIAGFSLSEANALRKAIGKKKAENMMELEKPFLDGCKKVGKVTEEEAKEIFESIRKSQRYSFNKCLDVHTFVELYGGCFKKINTLKRGDMIKCPENNEVGYVYRKVLNIYNIGIVPLIKVTLYNGLTITCSINHKFMDKFGKIKTLRRFQINGEEILTNKGLSYIAGCSQSEPMPAIDIEIECPDDAEYPHMFFANGGIITSNSHSVAYGLSSYLTAYAKAHFPLLFYKHYLRHTINKPDTFKQMRKLVFDAKNYGIEIQPPKLINKNIDFEIINNKIYYGLTNVRNIGKNSAQELLDLYNKLYYNDMGWVDFLFKIALKINKRCIKSLISAGALPIRMSREHMLYEHGLAEKINIRERKWISDNLNLQEYKTLLDLLLKLLEYPTGKDMPFFNKKRHSAIQDMVKELQNPSYSLKDTPAILASREESLFGVPLTCSRLDEYNIDHSNTTCKEFNNGKQGDMRIAAEINELHEFEATIGTMGFAAISDNTGIIESVVFFPEAFNKYSYMLIEGEPLLFNGYRSDKGSFVVKSCFLLK